MNNIIIYSIELAICLALFYLAYWLMLKNQTFFKLNRFYLLSTVVISLFIPIINVDVTSSAEGSSFITNNIFTPIGKMKGFILGVDGEQNAVKLNSPRKNLRPAHLKESGETVTTEVALTSTQSDNSIKNDFFGKLSWLSILFSVYLIGMVLFFVRFVANFFMIFKYASKNNSFLFKDKKVIQINKDLSPFSFLNFIFIGNKYYSEAELFKITSHEKVHIDQKHSLDLIFFELLFIIQWFNPFVWLYKSALKINHEYLADLGTLEAGVDMSEYQYSLLNHALNVKNAGITSSYSLSVKKRIAMMMQKRSSKFARMRVCLVLPVIVFLFSAFAVNVPSSPERKNKVVAEAKVQTKKDTSIKAVDIPVEYLRLLQGEYISTNDPNRERRIIFTELLGTLYGLDAFYSYKILPVGGEQFINPEDKASLVFNSVDKNNISLLLFGKINLKKQYFVAGAKAVQQRSLAFTVANVMLKSGVNAGLSYYNKAKDSSNCLLSENELNFAGYVLLEKGKNKEAAAIFKLNTEYKPESWNVYDSYAESLLALGDKTNAIANYKKSLSLNPGSKSGLQKLEELGVSPDELPKPVKVPVTELKALEGIYLSTNQPNWMRKITIKEENGALTGEDNGYVYQLIPMGNGKFINPDDGQSLVFNTENKNAISMLLFGEINMKKVVVTNKPILDLKSYAGHFVPEKKLPRLGPMSIVEENGKIYRVVESNPQAPDYKVELNFVADNIFFYTDKSARSVEFIITGDKVTGCILRRPDGTYKLLKE